MSNSYFPVVGGIEESIHSFSEEFRRQGHKVVVAAPRFEGAEENEKDMIRLPAIQHFFKEDVSVSLPVPGFLSRFMKEFQPDIIHSHHFFWVGDMALRLSRHHHVPLVFTHHIMLDQYVDFLPIHNEGVKRFVLKLATGYANLADCVISPSRAVCDILHQNGVTQSIHVIPTGVDVARFAEGSRPEFRGKWEIPEDAFVIGFVGRLNPEKNLEFLARAASRFLKQNNKAHCLIVGYGTLEDRIKNIFEELQVQDRLHFTGTLQGQDLIDAYHAMDLFIFCSYSETQGLVLLESLAAGTPVAALDAPVVREMIKDCKNGRLVSIEDENEFASAMHWFTRLNENQWRQMKIAARATADEFSIERCAGRLMDIYQDLKSKNVISKRKNHVWDSFKDGLKAEKELFKNALKATGAALKKNNYE